MSQTKTTADWSKQMRSATDLDELLETMRAAPSDEGDDWSGLPTFGGAEVEPTERVWSWDEERVLVSWGPQLDLRIVSREQWAERMGQA